MDRPFPLRFELPSPAKCLRVERVAIEDNLEKDYKIGDGSIPCWRLWLMANGDFTLGTFIRLCDNGKVSRVTWHENGTESVLEIRDG